MTTALETEVPTSAATRDEEIALRREAEALIAFKDEKVKDGDQTPCPACTVHVPLSANTCPTCGSDIAGNNALIRESLRRLDQINEELDSRAGERKASPKGQSLAQRIKRAFAKRAPEDEAAAERDAALVRTRLRHTKGETRGARLLDSIRPGQQITIIDHDDPWYLIRTPDGRTGWIFSTHLAKKK